MDVVKVDDEDLALDVIAEIGPGQSFLMDEHTYDRMRTQSKAEIFDRRSREGWLEATAGKTAAEVATATAIEIIESHQVPPLPTGTEETLDEMVAEFEARLRS